MRDPKALNSSAQRFGEPSNLNHCGTTVGPQTEGLRERSKCTKCLSPMAVVVVGRSGLEPETR